MKENLPNAYRPLKSTETSVHLHGDTKRKDIVSSGLKPSEEEYYERVPELKKKKKKKKKKKDILIRFIVSVSAYVPINMAKCYN